MKTKNTGMFAVFNYIINSLFAFVCIYPFYYIFLVSISDSDEVSKGSVVLLPSHFTIQYYIEVFKLKGILNAFFISSGRTIIGTAATLFFSAMLAYLLTKKELKGRKIYYRLTIFTMYANGGLIPWFITMKYLGLQNNFLLYILPTVISPFGMILIKTYIEQTTKEIEEAAYVDGAGYFMIFTRIILPVTKPILAAVAVFVAVYQWNAFQDNFFLVSKQSLQTMQMILTNYLQQAATMSRAVESGKGGDVYSMIGRTPPSPFTIKATVAIIATFPILFLYPSLQKYFVKGIMVGSIKG